MTLSTQMETALNQQLNDELYSAYLYLSMAAYCEADNLPGFAHWLRLQSQEELQHAMRFFDFMTDRSGRVRLSPVAQPPVDFTSPLELFEQALEHERQLAEGIDRLYQLADEQRDYACQPLLQWFIGEQIEEEKTTSRIVEQIRLAGNEGMGLYLLDRELGGRAAAGE